MIHLRLLYFVLPLAIMILVQEFGVQVLNSGMARVPRATETLAGFGLAWSLVAFLCGPMVQTRQLGLVLVEEQLTLQKVRRFVFIAALFTTALLATLPLTIVGDWLLDGLHGIESALSQVIRVTLLWMIPIPILRGLISFYTGLLMFAKRTEVVSYANIFGLGTAIASVLLLLPFSLIQTNPILLPILAIYASIWVELGITMWGYWRYVKIGDGVDRQGQKHSERATPPKLTYGYIFQFFWPLALVSLVREVSRVVINLFIAWGPNSQEALAVLAVVYPLGQLPYRWLNEMRNLLPAFRKEVNNRHHIQCFMLGSLLFAMSTTILLFWTPIREVILQNWIGLNPVLAAQARVPLLIYSFFPLVVIARAYLQGVALVEHRTKAMVPSAPSRFAAVLLTVWLLPFLGITGATQGIAALFNGFLVEAIVIWWGLYGRIPRGERR